MGENKRIAEISPGVFYEALSDIIRVNWNPLTEEVNVNFETSIYLRMGEDNYVSKVMGGSGVSITGEDLAATSFEINGKTITGLDLNIFVRMLYDSLCNSDEGFTTSAESMGLGK